MANRITFITENNQTKATFDYENLPDVQTDAIKKVLGITPSGKIDITENGEHDVTNYATASVEVEGGPQPTLFAPTVTGGVNTIAWSNNTQNGGFDVTLTAVVDGTTVTSPLTITQEMDGKTLTITASATNFEDSVTTVTLQYTSASPLTSQKDSSINEYQYALFTGGQSAYRLRFNDGTTAIGAAGTTLFIKQSNDVITSSNYLEITQTIDVYVGYVTKSNLVDNNFEINEPGTAFTPSVAKRVAITLTNIATGTEYKTTMVSNNASFGYLPAGIYSMFASIS